MQITYLDQWYLTTDYSFQIEFVAIWSSYHLSSSHFIKSPIYQVTVLSSYHLKLIQIGHHLDLFWKFHLKCMAFINHLHCGLILIWKYSPFKKMSDMSHKKPFKWWWSDQIYHHYRLHSGLLHSKCEMKLICFFQQFSVPLHLLSSKRY